MSKPLSFELRCRQWKGGGLLVVASLLLNININSYAQVPVAVTPASSDLPFEEPTKPNGPPSLFPKGTGVLSGEPLDHGVLIESDLRNPAFPQWLPSSSVALPAVDADPPNVDTKRLSGGSLAKEVQAVGLIERAEPKTLSQEFGSGCNQCSPQVCLCRPVQQALLEEHWGVQVGGWAQAGLFGSPQSRFNTPVLFNDRSDEVLLNQFYVFAENEVIADGSRWDVGGRIDLNYGTDSRFLTVPGLERNRDGTPNWNSEDNRYGIAMPQAYVEFTAPVSNGLSMKVGHFYSIAGAESIAPPCNLFYSRSYAFLYGQPFTLTGALATYQPNQQFELQLGYMQGWDAWNSDADTDGVLGRMAMNSQERRTSLAATVLSGKDLTGATAGVPLTEDRHLFDFIIAHRFSERLRGLLQCDFGFQSEGKVMVNPGVGSITFDSVQWGGIASYLLYEHNRQFVSTLRLEWFNDGDQSRLGIPIVFVPDGPVLEGGNYYAITTGLNFTPSRNVVLRPEVRWDWSDLQGNSGVPGGDASIRAFDERSSASQFTIGADLIVSF